MLSVGILDILFDKTFLATLIAAIFAFATIVTIGLPMIANDNLGQRLKAVSERREELRARHHAALNAKRSLRSEPVSYMKATLDRFKLGNLLESENTRQKLTRAGYRGQGPIVTFMFFRFVVPIVLLLAALFYFFVMSHYQMQTLQKICISVGIALLGFYVPDMYVSNIIAKRLTSIMRAFPDALDLLLICVESGMSVEASFQRVASEIGTQSSELAEELGLTTAELSYLPERREAFENLAKRCAHSGVKAVATALNQAERYGTPMGNALRVAAQENRDMRMMDAEKKAAALPAKLTVPMILFFLPVLFVVILGPAVMKIMHMGH
ncbi:MAG TPA: type II secretion system F family protein [Rhizomicrobium sp.]|nr:type II secretion system F family protein [Rhizomicrobium sp.]